MAAVTAATAVTLVLPGRLARADRGTGTTAARACATVSGSAAAAAG